MCIYCKDNLLKTYIFLHETQNKHRIHLKLRRIKQIFSTNVIYGKDEDGEAGYP
jgi:hypothetical protein